MKTTNISHNLNRPSNIIQTTIPFIIWLMITIIPMFVIIQYIKNKIQTHRKEQYSDTVAKLTKDSLILQKELQPINFINYSLKLNKLLINSNRVLNKFNKDYQASKFWDIDYNPSNYNKNRLVRHSPKYGNINTKSITKLSEYIQHTIGIKPSFIITFSPNDSECLSILEKPFHVDLNSRLYKKAMRDNYKFLYNKSRASILEHRRHTHKNEFITKHILGMHPSVFNALIDTKNIFSHTTSSIIKIISYPILKQNQPAKFVLIGIEIKKLDPYFILKQCIQRLQKKNIFKFGYSIKPAPYYYQNSSEIAMLAEIPLAIRALLKKNNNPLFKYPVIKLSYQYNLNKASLPQLLDNIKLVFLFITLIMYCVINNIFKQKKQLKRNALKKSIFLAIFSSAMVPITLTIVFWLVFSKIENSNRINHVIKLMNTKMTEFDKRIDTSKNRFLMYTNSKVLEAEKESFNSIDSLVNYYSLNSTTPRSKKLALDYRVIQIISAKNKEFTNQILGLKNHFAKTFRLILSVIKNLLLNTNFFKDINNNTKRKIRIKNDTAISSVSEILSINTIISIFMFLGQYSDNAIYSAQANVVSYLLKINGSKVANIFLMFLAKFDEIYYEFNHQFISHEQGKVFQKDGFNIQFFIYQKSFTNIYELKKRSRYISDNTAIKFAAKANTIYALGKNIRYIDLQNEKEPHITVARSIANSNYFAIGYAIPNNRPIPKPFLRFAFIGILLSLLSSAFIAWSVTNIILLPIPPTLTAISKLDNNNFSWKIVGNSNDEFSLLHDAFNNLSIKMLERNKMQQLVSEEVAELVSKDSNQISNSVKSVSASVLFSDIRGFTSISEKYDAEDVVTMLNEYFTIMVGIIKKHNGIINQLIGDAIQSVFYDEKKESSALMAVNAAIEMRLALAKLNKERRINGKYEIQNGIGITTGNIISGIVGSKNGRLDSTIIGDTVLLAEELESYSKYARKSFILIDEQTQMLTKETQNTFIFKSKEVLNSINIFEIDN